jgi:ribonucleoside-diphosphate reductase beta chain
MIEEAVDAETRFAEDLLSWGVAGLSVPDMRRYLEHVADERLANLGTALAPSGRRTRSRSWSSRTRELSNFFERGVSAYQVAVEGDVAFDQVF